MALHTDSPPSLAAVALDNPSPQVPGGGAYQALYRRYRPVRFSEVRGQDHVTRALRNAVREGRVVHAYLFSGPRGTGKTSTARILAMALNCEAAADGEPDGTCQSCLSVRSGASMDVFELDAASNRKLDEMRDLLSRVALGTPGRWKVYIIDEVHQLTPDAASALLKTLEEPPPHVVFVLATTDPQKVLPTIQSRTQHFEFRLLDGEVLTGLLEEINRDAGLGLPAGAVRLAVQRGRGSARDAESALEQLAAIGGDQPGTAYLDDLVSALAERDVGGALQAVARAVSAGVEPRRLGSELVERLREAFLAVQAPALSLLPAAETGRLAEQARRLGLPLLVRCMESVGQALVEMRDAVDPRVTLEVALVRLASPALATSPEALLERLERLERALEQVAVDAKVFWERLPKGPGETAAVPPPPGPSGARVNAAPAGALPPGTSGASEAPSDRGLAPARRPTAPAARGGSQPPGPSTAPKAPSGPAEARLALGALLKGPSARTSSPPSLDPGPAGGGHGPLPPAGPSGPTPQQAPVGALPSRDQLTKAWGDTVLASLERPGQFYLAQGRFSEVSDAAVLAFPDAAVMSRASKYVEDAEAALARHFGLRVPLRLVVDTERGPKRHVPPASNSRPEPGDQDDEFLGPDELAEAPVAPAVPAEQMVLDAFPGAVLEA